METKIIKIDKDNIDEKLIKEAAGVLTTGGLVAFPTETVYGLGANAYDSDAVKSIYKAKGRPSDNPLIVHFADICDIGDAVSYVPDGARKLFEKFSPGPLTVIMKKNERISDVVTAGLDTVAVRIPKDECARAFIKAAGVPVAAPSANLSGKPSPTTARHVIADMMGRIPIIIDGGDCEVGVESTVIDMSAGIPAVLRPGGITYDEIKEVVPNAVIDKHILNSVGSGERPKSPGMKYKHYAPDADVTVVEGDEERVLKKIRALLLENRNKKTGVLRISENEYEADLVINAGKDNKEYAKNLFTSLRKFDEEGIEVVYAEIIKNDGYGLAVRNRLYKSAGYKIIRV